MSEKASYLELIARRNPIQHRIVRQPLCLDMAAWDAFMEAKEAHQDAVNQAERDRINETARRTRHASAPATQATADALKAAEEAMQALSLYIAYRVPHAIEQDKIIARINTMTDEDGQPLVNGGTQYAIEHLAACFDHATLLDGTPVEDFTATSLRNELSVQANGMILAHQGAIGRAMIASEFPTPPKL